MTQKAHINPVPILILVVIALLLEAAQHGCNYSRKP